MKVIIANFDGALYVNNDINYLDKINQFVNEGNIFIIATGRNMTSLKKEIDRFNLSINYYICNDGALILDQYLNIIYRNDIDESIIRPLYNELRDNDNTLEVLLDTGSGYTNDINRSTNKMIARYFSRDKALEFVKKINNKYSSIYAYVSNNWINITKRTETKGSAINFLGRYYNLSRYPIYIIGSDINDLSMCNENIISYGIIGESNPFLDKYKYKVNNFKEAFDLIISSDYKNVSEIDKKQNIECFCGNKISFDWKKIPVNQKIVYIRCLNCGSELKRGNPYYLDDNK